VSTVPLLELPRRCLLSLLKSFVNSVNVGLRRYIDGDEAPTGAFVGTAKFFQSHPVSQELFFVRVFGQDKAIRGVTRARRNTGGPEYSIVFLCSYHVLFAKPEDKERNVAKTVSALVNRFSPGTLSP